MMGCMGGFGDRLRREREARGVSLGEISESTKISGGFLRSLEQEDFERLPGGIFNRGFVRAYSKFLGIDEDAMVADFDAAYEQYRAEQAPPPPLVPIEEKEVPAKDYRFSAAILIPLILLISIVLLWRHRTKAAEATQGVAATHSNSRGGGNRLPDVNGSKPRQSVENSKLAGADGTLKKVAGDSVAGNIQKQPDSGTALKSPESAAAPPSMRPIRVEIHANEDAWLSVIADGKTMMEGVLPAASTRKFRAQKNIYFTTGNAGGVEVSYNGRPLPPLGTSNEVKSLTFTPNGPRQ
jgi:cytoskeleton protein RodZ